jgi:hypothetical protein
MNVQQAKATKTQKEALGNGVGSQVAGTVEVGYWTRRGRSRFATAIGGIVGLFPRDT